MLLSDIMFAPGALAERGTYDLPALQGVCRYGRGEAILVPRSSGALAVVAANDTEQASWCNVDGSAIGFVQLPPSATLPHLPPSRMPLFKHSNGSYPTLAHSCLG